MLKGIGGPHVVRLCDHDYKSYKSVEKRGMKLFVTAEVLYTV